MKSVDDRPFLKKYPFLLIFSTLWIACAATPVHADDFFTEKMFDPLVEDYHGGFKSNTPSLGFVPVLKPVSEPKLDQWIDDYHGGFK